MDLPQDRMVMAGQEEGAKTFLTADSLVVQKEIKVTSLVEQETWAARRRRNNSASTMCVTFSPCPTIQGWESRRDLHIGL